MQLSRKSRSAMVAMVVLCAASSLVHGQSFPLPSAASSTPAAAPFVLSAGMTQTLVVDRDTLNAASTPLPASFSDWDMVAFDATSRYIFIPSETGSGAGLFRYDTQTGSFVNLIVGNGPGVRSADPLTFDPNNDDYSRLDPATLSPWNTVLTGEETTGGRLFEVLNPLSAGPFQVVWLSKIPAVGHEGLRFDSNGVLYFVDENNSGSIYKFVPAIPGDLSVGQSFVLDVVGFSNTVGANAAGNWNAAGNLAAPRTGVARWVAMTDAVGTPLTTANPFAYVSTTGGRDAADELGGTPYGRPEDLDFNFLANGNETLYFTATSENSVYAVEFIDETWSVVHLFASRNTLDLATGASVGTQLNSPDNLAVDGLGNIFIVEDQNPGDIWQAIDGDKDGVAESMGRWVSLGIPGSEPSGLILDPNDHNRFIVCVQHPSSGNEAVWSIEVNAFPGTGEDLVLASGVNTAAANTLNKTAFGGDVATWSLTSPNGTFVGAPYVLVGQLFPSMTPPDLTGMPSFVWVDLLAPTTFILVDGLTGTLPQVVGANGISLTTVLPASLIGTTLRLQAGASSPLAAASMVAVTEASEIVIQ